MITINQRSIRVAFNRIRKVKTWQLVIILVIGLMVSATFLRINNLEMDKRREAVKAADKAADSEKIRGSLLELQHYVSHHMNTSLGDGFYLEHQYNRDRDSALNAATHSTNPNAAVYQQASVECQSRFHGGVESFRNDYVACVAERVRALGASDSLDNSLNLPKSENYRYNFVSPFWSPDLAGFTVLFSAIITTVILLRIVAALILKMLLKYRFKSI